MKHHVAIVIIEYLNNSALYETPLVPIENVRHLFGYLEVQFWTMGLLEWRYGLGSLELEFGTPEARIFEIDIWKSRFPEWIFGRSVFQDGYLGPEYGSPEVRYPFPKFTKLPERPSSELHPAR
jgi:hypothetical protein